MRGGTPRRAYIGAQAGSAKMRRRYALGTILKYPIFGSCDLWIERSQSRTAFRSAIAAAVQHPVPVVAITQPNERMVCRCRSNSSQKCRYDRKTVRRCSERGLEAPISGPRKPRKRLIDLTYPGLTGRRLWSRVSRAWLSGRLHCRHRCTPRPSGWNLTLGARV